MAQINLKNKGLTLIELILYMGIFCFIFLVMMSSVFYLQKIIESNNREYYVKNQIYTNLNILQQYLYKSHITIENQNLNFFDKHDTLILTQTFEQDQMRNIYQDKAFFPMEYIDFESYNLELLDSGRVLKVEYTWLNNRGKTQKITDYLIVINQDS